MKNALSLTLFFVPPRKDFCLRVASKPIQSIQKNATISMDVFLLHCAEVLFQKTTVLQ